MQSENPLIADFVKMMNSAAGTFAGMTREARESARERTREFIGGMDFVSREEFDTVRDLAVSAVEQVEALERRIAALEGRLNAGAGTHGIADAAEGSVAGGEAGLGGGAV